MKKILLISFCFLSFWIASSSAQSTIPAWKVNQLTSYISNSDSVLVINFWATFCKPCVGEIPYYQSISNKYKNKKVKLMLVSLDMKDSYPEKITSFAAKHHLNSQIIWLNETDADYFCPLINKKWSGALPTTFFINKKCGYKKLIEQQLSAKEFESELKKAISN